MKTLISITLTMCLGCSLVGAGSLRVGLVNSNFLEFGTNIDTSKDGKKASIKIEQSILDAVLGSNDDPSDDVVSPGG